MNGERRRYMVLSAFMQTPGYHNYSWLAESSRAEEWGTLGIIADLTRQAEQAKLDAVFFADIISAESLMAGDTKSTAFYEPVTALSSLAALTSQIGLIGTASTSFNHPYMLARQFASLDLLSNGRAGWNIVTSWLGEDNFGMEAMLDPADRYRRATEFVDVATQLWRSWDHDAVIADRKDARWVDPSKVHLIDHHGEFFAVKGALSLRRSPQAGPLLVQAGSSGPGVDLGATYADLIYTAQPIKDSAVQFYAGYKEAVVSKGRVADEVSILPGIVPIVGNTDAEAEEFARELASLVEPERGRADVQRSLGIQLDDLELDEPIPLERFTWATHSTSRLEAVRKRAVEQNFTVRELSLEFARSTGHLWMVGSASKVAERMIDWFESRACDGFSLNPASVPEGFRRMCQLLVPELQERGYFHGDYAGGTLRENISAGRASRSPY